MEWPACVSVGKNESHPQGAQVKNPLKFYFKMCLFKKKNPGIYFEGKILTKCPKMKLN